MNISPNPQIDGDSGRTGARAQPAGGEPNAAKGVFRALLEQMGLLTNGRSGQASQQASDDDGGANSDGTQRRQMPVRGFSRAPEPSGDDKDADAADGAAAALAATRSAQAILDAAAGQDAKSASDFGADQESLPAKGAGFRSIPTMFPFVPPGRGVPRAESRQAEPVLDAPTEPANVDGDPAVLPAGPPARAERNTAPAVASDLSPKQPHAGLSTPAAPDSVTLDQAATPPPAPDEAVRGKPAIAISVTRRETHYAPFTRIAVPWREQASSEGSGPKVEQRSQVSTDADLTRSMAPARPTVPPAPLAIATIEGAPQGSPSIARAGRDMALASGEPLMPVTEETPSKPGRAGTNELSEADPEVDVEIRPVIEKPEREGQGSASRNAVRSATDRSPGDPHRIQVVAAQPSPGGAGQASTAPLIHGVATSIANTLNPPGNSSSAPSPVALAPVEVPATGPMRTIAITLDTADHGALDIRMTLKGRALTVHLKADRAETADALTRDKASLHDLLHRAGYDADIVKIDRRDAQALPIADPARAQQQQLGGSMGNPLPGQTGGERHAPPSESGARTSNDQEGFTLAGDQQEPHEIRSSSDRGAGRLYV